MITLPEQDDLLSFLTVLTFGIMITVNICTQPPGRSQGPPNPLRRVWIGGIPLRTKVEARGNSFSDHFGDWKGSQGCGASQTLPTEGRSEYQEPPRLIWCPSRATKLATVGGVTDPVFNSRFEGLPTPQSPRSEKSWAEKGGIRQEGAWHFESRKASCRDTRKGPLRTEGVGLGAVPGGQQVLLRKGVSDSSQL